MSIQRKRWLARTRKKAAVRITILLCSLLSSVLEPSSSLAPVRRQKGCLAHMPLADSVFGERGEVRQGVASSAKGCALSSLASRVCFSSHVTYRT